VDEAAVSLGSAERRRLALDLQDTVIQMVVGNLLRYQAILTLLDRGESAEATRLLRQSVRTQRAVLADLRRLMTRISPDAA
jgi:signal transduction histidine kinase